MAVPSKKTIFENGIYLFKGQLDVALIDKLRAKAVRCAARAKVKLLEDDSGKLILKNKTIKLTYKEVAKFALPLIQSEEFKSLKKSKELRQAIRGIFGDGWKFFEKNHSSYARITVPNRISKTIKPHQDSIYLGEGKSLFVIWIPLHDCPYRLGGLSVIPKSHKIKMQDHRNFHGIKIFQNDPRWRRFTYKKGDFLIFHYNTIHGPATNKTLKQSRISVDFRIEIK